MALLFSDFGFVRLIFFFFYPWNYDLRIIIFFFLSEPPYCNLPCNKMNKITHTKENLLESFIILSTILIISFLDTFFIK